MGVLRILLLPILAAVLAGCAATIPLLPAQQSTSTPIAESDHAPAAEETTQAEQPKPPARKPARSSTTSRKRVATSPMPTVGSPEWKKEKAEDQRKERHIKKVMESICTGC
jgi:hypothetical protein